MIDEKELRERIAKLVLSTGVEKAGFDTEEEQFAFKLGAEYGMDSAIDLVLKALKSDKAA